MTSIQIATNFDQPRPMSQQDYHHSPADSPHLHRPASQASLHLAPVSTGNYSPALHENHNNGPLTAYPGHFRPFTPSSLLPHTASYANGNGNGNGYAPTTAPPLSYFPTSSAPIYDARHSQAMMRTTPHAHPMYSATEHTASTRYSPDPNSAGGMHHASPPSATLPNHYSISSIQPQPQLQPIISVSDHQGQGQGRGHINPSLFNNSGNYPMSRSTSGASASDGGGNDMGRLLTPHYPYEAQLQGRDYLSPIDEMRKVSDPMTSTGGGANNGGGRNRLYPASYAPNYEANGGHGLGLGAHPQPSELYFRGNPYGDHYAMSSARGDVKPDLNMLSHDTEYERERQQQIMENRRLFEDVGLGQQTYRQQREVSGATRVKKTKNKRQSSYNGPVRASGRIASVGRASYANLDGGEDQTGSSDEYDSGGDEFEEDEFRPSKKARGRASYAQKASYSTVKQRRPQVELSLWGLLQTYPEIPHCFPLFYYTLNNDLTINSDSVPLIGSIPSTVTPLEKADMLAMYYHRGRRVLAQLDTFTSRCDRKYDGPAEKWHELEYHTRIAVRDVRRKVVERCENYKYTRRDILDKARGKGKWQQIEHGMIEWDPSSNNNDPANDLANVTLTLPTPPPSAYPMQHQQPRMGSQSSRAVRPFPRRAPSTAYANGNGSGGGLGSGRNMSATSPNYPHTGTSGMSYYNPSTAPQTAPPMYGEDEVPMSVQLPAQIHAHAPSSNSTTPTPMQMVNTPVPALPQMPGSSSHTPWSFHQSQSQSQSQSLTRNQGQELTPIMQVMDVNDVHPKAGAKRSSSEEGESELDDDKSDSGDDE